MKLKASEQGVVFGGIVPFVIAGLLYAGFQIRCAAADDVAQMGLPSLQPAPSPAATSPYGADPATATAQDTASPSATPSSAPSDTELTDTNADNPDNSYNYDETSKRRPKQYQYPSDQAPAVDVEPPLPNDAASTQVAAAAVPLATDPPLRQQFSDYDLTGIETPLFTREAINDFAERPINLTGNWSVKFHLSLDSVYDGNIFLRQSNVQSDFITRISPGITMRLGNADSIFYLVADYTAGFNIYVTHANESTIDNDFSTSFQWNLTKTTITVRAGVYDNSGQDVDVTDLVQQQLYTVGAAVHYQYSEKTSMDFSGEYERSDFNGLISSSQYDGQLFVNYDYSPRTQFGIGTTIGYLEVPGGSDQTFEQANLRATDRISGKLTLIAEAGAEFRQYDKGGGETLTPVFSVEGTWAIRDRTTLSLTMQRQIFASALYQNQDYTSTEIDLGVSERIGDRVQVGLAVGFVNAAYSAAAANVNASREDNYYYIRPSLQWRALSWLSVGIFYEYDQDLSSGGNGNSFTRDRGGVDIALLF